MRFARAVALALGLALVGCQEDRVVSPPPLVASSSTSSSTSSSGTSSTSTSSTSTSSTSSSVAASAPNVAAPAPAVLANMNESANDEAPRREGARTPTGPAAPRAAESELVVDRSSPGALLGSLRRALEARDLAALARVKLDRATKPSLDEDNLARARRDFLSHGRAAFWERVLANASDIATSSGERFEARIDMGGDLGTIVLVFERGADGWSLR